MLSSFIRQCRSRTFGELVTRKRTVIVADGFYEWHRHTKKPFRIRLKKRELFGFAWLYDTWVSPDGKRKLNTCTIITCKPNLFMGSIHDRMPVILTEDNQDTWLDRSITDTDTLISILQPYPEGEMYAYEVPTLVGNVRNYGPECIEPVSTTTM